MKKITLSILIVSLYASPAFPQTSKARIYVTDNPIENFSALVSGRAAIATAAKGDDPRTIEIQADLMKSCPNVQVTNDPSRANYVLVLRREGGKRSAMFVFGGLSGLAISAAMKVDNASLFLANGDLVYATKARSVEKAIQDLCSRAVAAEAIAAEPVVIPTPEPPISTTPASVAIAPITPSPATVAPPVAALRVMDPPGPEPLGDVARRYKKQ
jgi:hypothetical protein